MRRALLLCLVAAAAAACKRAPAAPITLHYTAIVDGKVWETSVGGEPAQIVPGAHDVPAPVEDALLKLAPGAETEVTVPLAYGPRDETKVESWPLEAFGKMAKDLKVGARVAGVREGKPAQPTVVALDGKSAVLDFNHPLAGKTVVYRLKRL